MERETIKRAIVITKMFETGPVTAAKIRDRFDISHQAALRWIDQLSRYLPVVATGLDREGATGRPGVIYELLK